MFHELPQLNYLHSGYKRYWILDLTSLDLTNDVGSWIMFTVFLTCKGGTEAARYIHRCFFKPTVSAPMFHKLPQLNYLHSGYKLSRDETNDIGSWITYTVFVRCKGGIEAASISEEYLALGRAFTNLDSFTTYGKVMLLITSF